VANLVSTRAYGTEGVFNWRIVAGLSFTSNLTWQHDWYTQYSPIAGCNACVGNALLRQPDLDANAGLAYSFRMFDVSIRDTYTGKTYTSDLNNIELPGYHLVHLDAGYSHQFTSGDTVRMSVSVYNLLDSQAATEGNPRQGSEQIGGQSYFVGRDVLPRRIFYRINYKF
jgi:iron complex outermembrane recepter protein